MAAASVAPEAFLTKRDGALIVDEVQRVPELFRTLKVVVDFILERPDGTLAGIEVKASTRVDTGDFKGLRELREAVGDDLQWGSFYTRPRRSSGSGKSSLPFLFLRCGNNRPANPRANRGLVGASRARFQGGYFNVLM